MYALSTPQVNPELKDAKALIDDSADFAGYKAVGFNYLMGDKKLETPPDFKPPKAMGTTARSKCPCLRQPAAMAAHRSRGPQTGSRLPLGPGESSHHLGAEEGGSRRLDACATCPTPLRLGPGQAWASG